MYPLHVGLCTGAECPDCGVFSRPLPKSSPSFIEWLSSNPTAIGADVNRLSMAATEKYKVSKFLDSRGEPVPTMPIQLLPSATVVIIDRGKVLVHKRSDNGQWGLIGGRQDIGESILQCAVREAKEETGLDISLGRLACVDSDPEMYAICAYPDGNIIQYTNMTFLASVHEGSLKISEESTELAWHYPHALPEPFMPSHLWRLKQAMSVAVGDGRKMEVR